MTTYTKVLLSGSTNGKQIKVTATATPGTTIHTAVSGTVNLDEVWLYCNNTSDAIAKLTLEFGGTTDPDNLIEVDIPAQVGLVLVVPGLLLQNGLVLGAFGEAANILLISGFVNRITQ